MQIFLSDVNNDGFEDILTFSSNDNIKLFTKKRQFTEKINFAKKEWSNFDNFAIMNINN